jgi:hypothetical protein
MRACVSRHIHVVGLRQSRHQRGAGPPGGGHPCRRSAHGNIYADLAPTRTEPPRQRELLQTSCPGDVIVAETLVPLGRTVGDTLRPLRDLASPSDRCPQPSPAGSGSTPPTPTFRRLGTPSASSSLSRTCTRLRPRTGRGQQQNCIRQGRSLGPQWIGDSAKYVLVRQMRLAGATITAISTARGIVRRTLTRHFRQNGIPLPSEDRRTATTSAREQLIRSRLNLSGRVSYLRGRDPRRL